MMNEKKKYIEAPFIFQIGKIKKTKQNCKCCVQSIASAQLEQNSTLLARGLFAGLW